MKTVKQEIKVQEFLYTYPTDRKKALEKVISVMTKVTGETPAIWGKDIIGFGEMTYSNTKLKDQPFFKVGLRMAKNHMTLYLNAYHQGLMDYADLKGIKHGMGCYHIKKAHEKLDQVKALLKLSME
ncbi:MAG: hypothetical protein ACO3MF_03695 [Acholeplasmataceae bacterium]